MMKMLILLWMRLKKSLRTFRKVIFMSNNAILLSIRPQYANKIFEGRKRVELRRICPKYIKKGDLVLIYVSSPVKSLCGAFQVDKVVEKPLPELWKAVKGKAGVSRKEFNQYYQGLSVGTAIFFNNFWKLSCPIELRDLREQRTDFQPPQNFRYATDDDLIPVQHDEFMSLFTLKLLEKPTKQLKLLQQ